MQSITAATLGLTLVILLPGAAIVWLLAREKIRWWEAAAIVPAVGLGFTYVLAVLASLVGLRFDLPLFGLALLGLFAAVVGKVLRHRRQGGGTGMSRPSRSEYVPIALLIAAILVGASMWAAVSAWIAE